MANFMYGPKPSLATSLSKAVAALDAAKATAGGGLKVYKPQGPQKQKELQLEAPAPKEVGKVRMGWGRAEPAPLFVINPPVITALPFKPKQPVGGEFTPIDRLPTDGGAQDPSGSDGYLPGVDMGPPDPGYWQEPQGQTTFYSIPTRAPLAGFMFGPSAVSQEPEPARVTTPKPPSVWWAVGILAVVGGIFVAVLTHAPTASRAARRHGR